MLDTMWLVKLISYLTKIHMIFVHTYIDHLVYVVRGGNGIFLIYANTFMFFYFYSSFFPFFIVRINSCVLVVFRFDCPLGSSTFISLRTPFFVVSTLPDDCRWTAFLSFCFGLNRLHLFLSWRLLVAVHHTKMGC